MNLVKYLSLAVKLGGQRKIWRARCPSAKGGIKSISGASYARQLSHYYRPERILDDVLIALRGLMKLFICEWFAGLCK